MCRENAVRPRCWLAACCALKKTDVRRRNNYNIKSLGLVKRALDPAVSTRIRCDRVGAVRKRRRGNAITDFHLEPTLYRGYSTRWQFPQRTRKWRSSTRQRAAANVSIPGCLDVITRALFSLFSEQNSFCPRCPCIFLRPDVTQAAFMRHYSPLFTFSKQGQALRVDCGFKLLKIFWLPSACIITSHSRSKDANRQHISWTLSGFLTLKRRQTET